MHLVACFFADFPDFSFKSAPKFQTAENVAVNMCTCVFCTVCVCVYSLQCWSVKKPPKATEATLSSASRLKMPTYSSNTCVLAEVQGWWNAQASVWLINRTSASKPLPTNLFLFGKFRKLLHENLDDHKVKGRIKLLHGCVIVDCSNL